MQVDFVPSGTFGVGPCAGIVEPFKLFLCVTAPPSFLVLELRAPMGTCPGQDSNLQHADNTCLELDGIKSDLLLISVDSEHSGWLVMLCTSVAPRSLVRLAP